MDEIILDDFEEPNPDCQFNYLLDTAAVNRFAEHRDWIDIAEKSLELGFHYYKTANQDYELAGHGARTYDIHGVSHIKITDSFKKKMLLFDEILKRLNIMRVSSIGSLMPNHWALDGTYRVLNKNSNIDLMAEEIFQFNEKKRVKNPFYQHYDAMSAEAAIYNNCILVSDDNDLISIVNKHFPKKAIKTCELIKEIQLLLG